MAEPNLQADSGVEERGVWQGLSRGDGNEHGSACSVQERAGRWEDSRDPTGW